MRAANGVSLYISPETTGEFRAEPDFFGCGFPALRPAVMTPLQAMCGIVAFLSRNGAIAPEALQRAAATLHHRGPDNRQQWIGAGGRVGLGHARLSIIDLTTGDQPIANEDGKLQIVVNGEFYDFERIRREL